MFCENNLKSNIASFINIQEINSLGIIFRISKIHSQFSKAEIQDWYFEYKNQIINFEKESALLCEILVKNTDFMKNISDDFFLEIYTDLFIQKNEIECNNFCDNYDHNFFEFSECEQFENEQNDVKCKQQVQNDVKSRIKKIKDSFFNYQYLKINSNPRIINCINKNLLNPKMFDISNSKIKLTKMTFKIFFDSNNTIDIPELMLYQLDSSEIEILSSKFLSDSDFADNCRNHILDQGILNETMYVIAGLLSDINNYKISKSVDFRKITPIVCNKHNKTFRNFDSFEPVGNLTSHEVYFLYLFSKSDISDDLDEIKLSFKRDFKHNTDIKNLCSNSELISNSQLNTNSESILNSELITNSQFNSSQNLNQFSSIESQNIFENILDFIYSKNFDLGFDKIIFDYFINMSDKKWYERIFAKYADKIFENEIKPEKLNELYDKTFRNWNYLNFYKNEIFDTQIVDSEPSMVDTQIVNSDFSQKRSFLDQKIPILDFRIHKWLTDDQKSILLEKYAYDIKSNSFYSHDYQKSNSLYSHDYQIFCENFLICKNFSEYIKKFFIDYFINIPDKILKGRIMCKLDYEIKVILDVKKEKLSKKFKINDKNGNFVNNNILDNNNMINNLYFTVQEAKNIISNSNNLFSLKDFFMNYKGIKESQINDFLKSLKNDQIDLIKNHLEEEVVNQSFLTNFLNFIKTKYEFPALITFLEFSILNYNESLILEIQKYIIFILEDAFITEEYFYFIEKFYKLFLKFDFLRIKKNNEKILNRIILCGKAMGKDVYIGNIKE